ncbi:hypothetical protein GLYMA_14G185500v4 [Glycine max]|nr:hypothetical protein GYH30_040470 [Glycine max]KRH16914.2 hypothetical protein GLYMA_14G185500v4 [Glycine max]
MNQIHMRSTFMVRSLGAVWRPALGGPSSPNTASHSTRSHHALLSLCLSFVSFFFSAVVRIPRQIQRMNGESKEQACWRAYIQCQSNEFSNML